MCFLQRYTLDVRGMKTLNIMVIYLYSIRRENKRLKCQLEESLGYQRMCNFINRDKNKHYSKRRIQRIMRVLGIKSVILFCNEDDLRQSIVGYIDYYNNYRYQERFNNLAPIEVRNAALNSKQPLQYPIPGNKRIQAYKAELEQKKQKQSA